MREHSNYSKTAPKKYRTKLAPPKARQLNRIEKVKSSQSFSRPDEADPLGVKMFPFFGDYLRSYIMDGQVWFHRNDVLERLSLIESPKWNRLLLPRERQSRAVQVLRESSNMDVVGLVAETGLYKLMVSSKDRRAEQFRELGGEMVMKLSREGDPNDAKIWQSCREIMQSVRRIYREEAARFVERMASNPFEQGNEFGEAGIIPGTELEIPW